MRRFRPCPLCSMTLLEPVSLEGIEVDACPRCGGLYFDAGELAQVVERSVGSLSDQNALGSARVASEMACPGCSSPLMVHSFEGEEGNAFDVDVCHACQGIWLDRGELREVQKSRAQEIIERPKTWKTWLFQFLLQLPVEFNLKPRRFPLITVLLLICNTLIFLGLLMAPNVSSVFDAVALFPSRIGDAQWMLSLISHQFLHGGVLHLLMNLYFLYILGDNVEDVLGRGGFLLFFVAMGILGGLIHTLIAWGSVVPMVGASGAISGVMAAYAVFFRRAKLTFMLIVFQFKVSAPAYVSIWLGLNLLGLLLNQGKVAWGAHLGGFAGGLLVAALLDKTVAARHPLLTLLRR
ncbi:MAG: rhomboid family intramembrane serine protease [Deltaproteobacteria bacterium]|nr:rhomboid family intramembrane serine protease [Deltaproteobacteria bacterium]